MTTMELIDKHGIGYNCLADAYDLGVKQGRIEAIEEAESKVKEYASIWMSYHDGMSKEQIAQEALNSAKRAMIYILEKIKEEKNDKNRR